ncbi:peptidase [Saccharothrix obliqua]|uniref:peptidase n=1 Tax=Saccharothrix obliqua TaxID=2861747 RepID=UPI001C5E414E|nr:peptidase [Saccharothrix obliqua]MBW4718263.1 peptidase [Saccharothrix obliqua]
MPLRRTAVAVAVTLSALSVTTAVLPALSGTAHAEPVTAKSPTEAAAGWLARQLVDGERFEVVAGGTAYPDQGLTIDALLAFDAAGVAQDNAAKALAWLGRPDVVQGFVSDEEGSQYAGGYAKLALAVLAQGGDPTSFGGVDLVQGLLARQDPSGRFTDRTSFPSDLTNNFTQSIAVIALERHGAAPPAAVDYLAAGACPGGGYPLKFAQPRCEPQVDATAMAVQALLAAGRAADATAALDWLAARQQADGGFVDDGLPDAVAPNANSTGLAAQALRVGGRTAAADRAAAHLVGLQVGCGDAAAGAIAYDAGGFRPGNAVRATAQAVLGLAGTSLLDISSAGDRPAAPVPDCPTRTTTPTTTTATVPTTSAAPPATEVTTTTAGFVVAAGGDLARTGAVVGPALWLGVLLLAAGVLAVALSRKRHTTEEKR